MYTLFFLSFSKLNYTGVVKVKSNNWFVYKLLLDHFYNNFISIHFY